MIMPENKNSRLVARIKSTPLIVSLGTVLALSGAVNAQQNADSYLDLSQERLSFEQPYDSSQVPRGANVGRVNPENQPVTPKAMGSLYGPEGPQYNQLTPQQEEQLVRAAQAQSQMGMGAQPLPSPVLIEKKRPNIPQEVADRLYPMTPDEIRQVLSDLTERQGAAIVPEHNKMVGVASQYDVDMSLGATPPIVRVARGLGAMVNFVDAQGSPWPIVSATNFHAEAASVSQVADHVLSVSANSPYLSGSVGVILEGLSTPIQFVIVPANDRRDYRVDLRIPQLAPDSAPTHLSSNLPAMGGSNIMEFLYGATPEGATRLKVSGQGATQSNTRAWQNSDGRLVLRSSAKVISPSWVERQAALDGTSVYLLASTPVVKVSVDGQESTFYLEGLQPMSHFSKKAEK